MSDPGFGVYLHWPYCSAICPYCDFNVYRPRGAEAEPLLAAIERDVAEHAVRFGRRPAQSIFFGGGTPSLLSGAEIARLIAGVERAFGLLASCEITLEANPEDAARFAEHVSAGVNRLSIGVQALNDADLKALGRHHGARAARDAIEAAARTGARVSADLIYAREGQSVEAWRAELREALALPVEHLSLYQLTIEPETAFARKVERGALAPPDADEAASLYEVTEDLCAAHGFPGYEISNYARTPAAQSQHNLIYWRSGEWVGAGPGAHGRLAREGVRIATEAQRRPSDYIDAVREHGVGWMNETPLTPEQSGDEILLMGLRVAEGVEVARIEAMRGSPLDHEALAWLVEQGLVTHANGRVALTRSGRPLANKIAAELAA
ncbi:MAG: radical SAM family heme chaperone HemW [Hyphomonadaceae bacterium]|nr:radical SAM family heme chaperone HemW [Hyphomonadaceae bacterium]